MVCATYNSRVGQQVFSHGRRRTVFVKRRFPRRQRVRFRVGDRGRRRSSVAYRAGLLSISQGGRVRPMHPTTRRYCVRGDDTWRAQVYTREQHRRRAFLFLFHFFWGIYVIFFSFLLLVSVYVFSSSRFIAGGAENRLAAVPPKKSPRDDATARLRAYAHYIFVSHYAVAIIRVRPSATARPVKGFQH